jgi:hypothetical protein
MTATNTTKDNDRLECISESHLQYMRSYCAWEEKKAKATLERFLEQRLSQRGKACPAPVRSF